jgi:hypothetical protein
MEEVDMTSGACSQGAFFGFNRKLALAVAEAQGLV